MDVVGLRLLYIVEKMRDVHSGWADVEALHLLGSVEKTHGMHS